MNTWKAIQRRAYDILSHRYSLIILFPLFVISIICLFIIEIGEVWILWSTKGSDRNFLKTTSKRVCGKDAEIDVVYTWVNGSDPLLIDNLRKYRDHNDGVEGWPECHQRDCIPSHIVAYRGCSSLQDSVLNLLPSPRKLETGIFPASLNLTAGCKSESVSLISFRSIAEAAQASQVLTKNGSFSQTFWTTDLGSPGSSSAPEWVRLFGLLPNFLTLPSGVIMKKLTKQLHLRIIEVWPYPEQGCVIVKLPTLQAVDHVIVKSGALAIGGEAVFASRISLVLHVPLSSRVDQFAPSRFEDKEELRYSLRSLEQHASWVRHVYLVTNGQIPHWLDLDNPRISVVTHDDIFLQKEHLPTFSSPAIESHLHRIKGLSTKFLYLNDDIFFAQDVWPEDFFTNSQGYKVYLSWPVPDCSPSCLWSWVSDGSCDPECNVAECGFDGGDCNETDSGPNTSRAQVPKEEFSIYDDPVNNIYDLGFENVDNMVHNLGDGNYNYLQPPDLVESDMRHTFAGPISEGGLDKGYHDDLLSSRNKTESRGSEKIAGIRVRRPKRTIVKKNLASNTYEISSTAVGRSGDFVGSVTDSKLVIEGIHATANMSQKTKVQSKTILSHIGIFLNQSKATEENNRSKVNFVNIKPELVSHQHIGAKHEAVESVIDGIIEKIKRVNKLETNTNASNHNMGRRKINMGLKDLGKDGKATTVKQSRLIKAANVTKSTRKNQRMLHILENDLNESVDITISKKEQLKRLRYGKPKPRILDSFAESLLHVNMLYNRVYGFETRRVPAHAPHLIDRKIMHELQNRFHHEWDETSSHKLRSPKDMQYAFSYFYFLMSEEEDVSVEELFKVYDTDRSGTWSDREIRTLMTKLYPAPLNPLHLMHFEEIILTCAREEPSTETPMAFSTPMYERYQDSPLPIVTWHLVKSCSELKKLMLKKLGRRNKYQFQIVREWSREVTFKMLTSNVSLLVGHLDDIRRNPKKFVCLNDNLDPEKESENTMVGAVLRDFYHSLFPAPSRFELPHDMRNRFLHVRELQEWKHSRSRMHTIVILAVITLTMLTLSVLYPDELRHYGRRIFECICLRRRRISRTRCRSHSPRDTPGPQSVV